MGLLRPGLADLAQIRHPLRVLLRGQPHEPDFALFRHLPSDEGLFLDLGAHAGHSSASFHLYKPRFQILAFEPDPALAPSLRVLRRLLRGRFDFRSEGVGARRGMATLYVPTVGARRLPGEASFDRASLEDHEPTRRRLQGLAGSARVRLRGIQRPVVPLDDLALEPAAIKLDLQGGEWDAVQGMMATLERHRPLVLMENNRHSPRIAVALEPVGYRPMNYDAGGDRLCCPPNPFEALNVVLATAEHLRHVPAAGVGLGLSPARSG